MFSLTDQPIASDSLRAQLSERAAGACVTFEGWVRDFNDERSVSALDYEAYPALAVSEGETILNEAREQFPIIHALCVHRVGHLEIGDLAVWVGVSAAHRGVAFDACRYIIDQVKARVPIWKNEAYTDGQKAWVENPVDDLSENKR